MDSKRKGKSWVGNIYHQFESIIQDADDFMSKGNVKYVENQVQSVKHDVLPPLGEKVKCKENLVIAKPVEQDHMESVSTIGATPICVTENQFYVEQGSLDILGNSKPSWPREYHAMQFIEHPFPDSPQEVITDLSSGQDDDVIIWNGSVNAIENNMTRNLIPVTTNSNSTSEISGTFNDNHYTNGWVLEDDILTVKDPNFNEMDFLSAPPLDPADIVHEETCPATDSPVSSGCDAVHRSGSEDGPLRDVFLTRDESFDVANTFQSTKVVFSYFSCNDEEAETRVISSISKFPNSTQEDESICSSHIESNYCAYIDSTMSSSVTAHEDKATDMHSIESTDINASMTHGSVFSVTSSQSNHEDCHEKAQSKLDATPFETVNSFEFGIDDMDMDMETIDLSTNVEEDARRRGVMNGHFIKPTSHRRKNFRYYKSLIQDSMASRKRVSKEYEHLSIWYGDIDMESRHNFESSFLPSTTSVTVNSERTKQSFEIPEAEWELL